MAKIRHQIFQIPLDSSGKISEKYDTGPLKEINDFLNDGKRIYVSHSITTTGSKELVNPPKAAIERQIAYNHASLTGPQHKQAYNHYRYVNRDRNIIISLVYKELEEDEIEEGIYDFQSSKIPKTKKSLNKPDVQSEADKLLVNKDNKLTSSPSKEKNSVKK